MATPTEETLVNKYKLNKVLKDEPRFSAYHSMIPKRYVPSWLLDIKNRKLITQVHAGVTPEGLP
jgi:hypothetical protein